MATLDFDFEDVLEVGMLEKNLYPKEDHFSRVVGSESLLLLNHLE